jgi:hypothetical protein
MKNDEKLARAARGSDIGHMLTMDYEGKVDKLVAHTVMSCARRITPCKFRSTRRVRGAP